MEAKSLILDQLKLLLFSNAPAKIPERERIIPPFMFLVLIKCVKWVATLRFPFVTPEI